LRIRSRDGGVRVSRDDGANDATGAEHRQQGDVSTPRSATADVFAKDKASSQPVEQSITVPTMKPSTMSPI
jgi:hypothetical protein